MSKTITIDEDKFINILCSTSTKFCKTERDILKFAIFCGEVHTALFGDDEDKSMSKTITINEGKFIDIWGSTSAKFCKTELDVMGFAIFCGEVRTALFGRKIKTS